jgi:hypothetical protein
MAGSIAVDPQALQALSGTLADVYGKMIVIDKVTPDFGNNLGGAKLTSALSEFSSTWKYGMAEIGTNLKSAAACIQSAAEGYAEAEDHVCLATTTAGQ